MDDRCYTPEPVARAPAHRPVERRAVRIAVRPSSFRCLARRPSSRQCASSCRAGPAAVQKRTGTVTEITALGPAYRPGRRHDHPSGSPSNPAMGVDVTFENFAPVTLSPTLRVDGSAELNELVFHLRQDRDGFGLSVTNWWKPSGATIR